MIRRKIDLSGNSLELFVPSAGPTPGDWELQLRELVEIIRRRAGDDVAESANLLMQSYSVAEVAQYLEIKPYKVRHYKEIAEGILLREVVRSKSA